MLYINRTRIWPRKDGNSAFVIKGILKIEIANATITGVANWYGFFVHEVIKISLYLALKNNRGKKVKNI